jgi:HKD family nuclease
MFWSLDGRSAARASTVRRLFPAPRSEAWRRNCVRPVEVRCMDLKVLAQPYRESVSGQTFVTTALEDPRVTEALIVTAWLRESGLNLLVPGLEAIRRRNGRSRLLFGVDLQGTSRQAVELAKRHFNDLRVVHDPSGRTFHPKLYLASGHKIGYAAIGSNNLTAGGLWHNYEAALLAIFDPSRERDIADGIETYAQRLLDDKAICKRVTQAVFNRLVSEGWLVDEEKDRKHRHEDRPQADRRNARSRDGKREPLFAASLVEKRSRPAPTRKRPARPLTSQTRRRIAVAPDCWWKQLGAGDAQRPPAGHRTGNITLTGVPPGQDRETFFRNVFFGGERWRSSGAGAKCTDSVTISAQVLIGNRDLGARQLTIIYRSYRAEHGRATTVLRWGEDLRAELTKRDLTGWFVLLERAEIGAYRLCLTRAKPA